MNTYSKNILVAFLASFVLGLHSCKNQASNNGRMNEASLPENQIRLTEKQFQNAHLEFTTLLTSQISSTLKLHGKIDVPPQNMISVSVPLGGYLKSTNLLPGMHVRKGEVIAKMEDQQYIQLQEDYLTALNKLELYRKEFYRQKELNQSKAVSDKAFQQAETAFKEQEILVSSWREKLKLININPSSLRLGNISRFISIYSPIDGFVSKVNVNIGKYVNPSEVMFELVNPSDIHLNLTVFEKDISLLSIGQKVMAYTNNDTSAKHPCEIILIGKDLTAEGSVEVHCHFDRFDNSLFPGMYMNADIETSQSRANVLPEEAVVRYEAKHYIFIQKGDKLYEMKEVQLGEETSGQIEIISQDILPQDKIVSKGSYTLLMALKNKSEE
jgi:cobalt-zinc-cadmium efflux system membrane fusion protein